MTQLTYECHIHSTLMVPTVSDVGRHDVPRIEAEVGKSCAEHETEQKPEGSLFGRRKKPWGIYVRRQTKMLSLQYLRAVFAFSHVFFRFAVYLE